MTDYTDSDLIAWMDFDFDWENYERLTKKVRRHLFWFKVKMFLVGWRM